MINTSRPEYLEAFVKQCYDAGLDEESTALLHHTAHTLELLQEDPNYRAGFESELSKQAFGDPTTTTGQVTSMLDPGNTGSVIGGGAGLIGGVIAGAKLLPRILRGVPRFGAIPKVLGLLGAASGLWGGSSAGRAIASPSGGASPDQTFIPSYMRGGAGAVPDAASDISEHHSFGLGNAPGASGSNAVNGIGMEPGMRSNIAAQGAQLKAINDQIAALHTQAAGASSTPGLQGSERAQAMDNWFRSHPNGGLAYKAFNWLTGADQKAQGLLAEQQALEEHNKQLEQQRQAIQGITTPLM